MLYLRSAGLIKYRQYWIWVFFLCGFACINALLNPLSTAQSLIFGLIVAFIFAHALTSAQKRSIKIDTLFGILFFGSYFLNLMALSRLQVPPTYLDLYFIVFPGLLVYALFNILQGIKFKTVRVRNIAILDINKVFYLIFFTAICAQAYVSYQTGIRLSFFIGIENYRSLHDITVPYGISGISNVLRYSLLILFVYLSGRKKLLICLFFITVAIINAKRGDLMRLTMFLMVYYSFIELRLSKKQILKIIIMSIFGLQIFALIGELRQSFDSTFSITEQLGFIIDSKSLAWLYGYTAINFDVYRQFFLQSYEHSYTMIMQFLPFLNVAGFQDLVVVYDKVFTDFALNGFSAATFLKEFVYDFGGFFIFEFFVFLAMLAAIYILIVKFNFLGVYLYFWTFISFSFFGNYLFVPQIFYTLIFGILLSLFTKNTNKVYIQ